MFETYRNELSFSTATSLQWPAFPKEHLLLLYKTGIVRPRILGLRKESTRTLRATLLLGFQATPKGRTRLLSTILYLAPEL